MTAVVKVDLKAQYPEKASDWQLNDNDLLAAFNGETCLGVASPKEGLFFLYIAGTEGAVTLRYYSAHYKNFFEAKDAFTPTMPTSAPSPNLSFLYGNSNPIRLTGNKKQHIYGKQT